MASCGNCKSERIASVSAKCSDMFNIETAAADYQGHVPRGIGIGGGDYIEFDYCWDCGMIQSAEFPVDDNLFEEQE